MKNSTQKIIISVLLTINLMAGATPAQENDKRGNNAISWYEYDGVETFAGTLDSINAIYWSDTFVLQSTRGSQTNSLNLSINSSATTGGTGAFEQSGKQHIVGTFSAATNYIGSKRFMNGALSFNF